MNSLDFRKEGASVVLVLDGRRALEIGWRASLDALRQFDEQIRAADLEFQIPESGIHVGGVELTFRQELGRILVIAGGRLLFDAPTAPSQAGVSIARLIWSRWMQATKELEEEAHAEEVARDAAILCLSGAPIGLTSNPKIQEEAAKLAEGDRDLRRFMGSSRRQGMPLPAPTLRSDVGPFERAQRLIKHLSPEQVITFRAALN